MYPYFFTLSFLTLLALHTTHTYRKGLEELIEPQFERALEKNYEKAQQLRIEVAADALAHKKGETKPKPPIIDESHPKPSPSKSKETTNPSLNYSKMRPPNTARLNLYPLIKETTPESHKHFAPFCRLLENLYKDPHLAYHLSKEILSELHLHIEEMESFSFPEQLATLPFKNDSLRSLFISLLKGTYVTTEGQPTPSLLDYLSFNTKPNNHEKRLNFLFAPPALLHAFCPNEALFEQLLVLREETWEEIDMLESMRKQIPHDKWKGRDSLKKELIERFDFVISRFSNTNEIKEHFNFSLGKKGNTAFIYDAVTQSMVRKPLKKIED